ncbi:hypothetical protein DVR12_23930 [Chitinophaga silvatica]|uniref:Uncharacterized protein n=1 Tax=Chitinophaga silvatica TaxID=2282649 RepID=A0A3E1Y473_9BACT|nr:hypothetical protein [Chitinophaga silvatica]RFS19287.1 hypothetical protein DVR12_23930 [Chitinophaga silvatica]
MKDQIAQKKQNLAYLGHQKEKLLIQQEMIKEDLKLAQQNYNIHQQLAKDKVIAPLELRQEESRLLSKKWRNHNE